MADAPTEDDADGSDRTVREPMEVPAGGLQDVERRDERVAEGALDGAVVGALAYLLIGLGVFLALLLMATVGENAVIGFGFGELQFYEDYEVFIASLYAYSQLTLLVPLAAVGIGIYAAEIDSAGINPGLYAGVATLVGSLSTLLVLLALAVSFSPPSVTLQVGDEFLGLLGAVTAAVFVAAVTGLLFHARRT